MKYYSTRGRGTASGAEAILTGIAPDGGLFAPERFPAISQEERKALAALPYAERVAFILDKFLPEYGRDTLLRFARQAYGRFDEGHAAPLHRVADGLFSLELWHGPTMAFKDMALTMLPHLLTAAMEKSGDDKEIVILVATSGDTGKAALEGFRDVPGTRCAVYYPENGVSPLQKMQMATQPGGNMHVIAVRGNFDDAQTGVKAMFTDPALAKKLAEHKKAFSSANSINVGRLVPQVAYYFSAYCDMVAAGAIADGDEAVFCVPTGNFGNILAGIYAKSMGLPVKKFICASNDNNVLADFIQTGVYNRNRPFHQTSSPSMDILISSNLERLLFELAGRDAQQVADWMKALRETGKYDIGPARKARLGELLYGGWCDEKQVSQTIADIFARHGYLVDTHTAVAFRVLDEYRRETGDTTPATVVSTASPYKFVRDVAEALGIAAEGQDDFALSDRLAGKTGLPVPPQVTALKDAPVLHDTVCDIKDMEAALCKELHI